MVAVGGSGSSVAGAGGRSHWVAMAAVFTVVHAGYYSLGVVFDDRPLREAWQYLDPALLTDRLWESLLYLHSQPVLFNLFLGLSLNLFGEHTPQALHAVYLSIGFGIYLATFSLTCALGVSRRLSLALSTALVASPAFILYEHWAYYSLPLALIVLLAALQLPRFLRSDSWWQGFLFFGLLGLLGGIWSAFHIGFFVLVVLLLLWLHPGRRRLVLLSAFIPFLLLGGFYLKNLVLFDRPTVSTWLGMNLANITTARMPATERERLVGNGTLSELALIPPFAKLEQYPAELREPGRYDSIPALSQYRKTVGGKANYNHYAYIAISDAYLRDALYVVRHYPRVYLNGLGKAWYFYFRPASELTHLGTNRNRIATLDSAYNDLVYGGLLLPAKGQGGVKVYLFLLLGLPAVLVYGVWVAWKRESREDGADIAGWRATLVFVCAAIAFVAVAGNLLELGENNRFRFVTDPLSVALLGLLVQRTIVVRLARNPTRRRS